MSFSFEARLRDAERTINTLIETTMRNGGGVYICDRDGSSDFVHKFTGPIRIVYWMPVEEDQKYECQKL